MMIINFDSNAIICYGLFVWDFDNIIILNFFFLLFSDLNSPYLGASVCVCMTLVCCALPSLPPPPQASSGSDSSDIETLDCPGPDDFYEDHTQGYSSLHSSLLSSSLSGFTFVEDAGEVATYAHQGMMYCPPTTTYSNTAVCYVHVCMYVCKTHN